MKRLVCPNLDSIPCSVHVETLDEAMPKFRARATPSTFVCDPQGTVLGQVAGLKAERYVRALQKAQGTIKGKPVPASTLAAWDAQLAQGDKGFLRGDFQVALAGYRDVEQSDKAPEFLRKRAARRIAKLTEAALEAIMQAEFLEEAEARPALERLAKAVKGLPEAEEAVAEALDGLGE